MSYYFKRNINIYISKGTNITANASNTVQLNVVNFSYNTRTRSDRASRETIDPNQIRTNKPFIAAVSPVEFTLTTYINPVVDTNVTSPEEYLWVSLLGQDSSLSSSPTSSTIDFADGNVPELQNLTLWFSEPNQSEGSYRLDNAIVDSATINFDINGLAEIQWKGRALNIVEDNSPPAATDRTSVVNYIKNKISTISLTTNSVAYNLALTGGSVTIDNNVTFYGRVRLGETTLPVGHYTGNRSISGSLDFYMRAGTNTSVSLFNELLTNASNNNYESTHLGNIIVNIGGISFPNVSISIPEALLSVPTRDYSQVLSLNLPYEAQESPGNYCSVTYNAFLFVEQSFSSAFSSAFI